MGQGKLENSDLSYSAPNWLRSGPAISLATKVRRGLGGVYNYLLYTGHQLLWHNQAGPKEVITVGLGEVTGDEHRHADLDLLLEPSLDKSFRR